MNKSGSIKPIGPDIKVTLVHAEHSSELVYKNPATSKDELHVGGEPGGFIVEFENGFKVWHMGDTGVFGDMKLIGEMYKPDLVLMPIGGGQFVMNPADAAFAARDLIKAKTLIPMHYGTNAALPGTPAELLKAPGRQQRREGAGDAAGRQAGVLNPPWRYRPSSLRPGCSSGRRPSGQWNRRCSGVIGRSLMLAKRRVMKPCALNSQFSLP